MKIRAMGLPDNRIRFNGELFVAKEGVGLSVNYERKSSLQCAIIRVSGRPMYFRCWLRVRGLTLFYWRANSLNCTLFRSL